MNRFNFSINFLSFFSIITAASFLIFIIMGAVFLWPKVQELNGIKKNIEEKETEIKMGEEYLSELNVIKADLEKYKDELSKIDSALPDGPSVPSFFNFLQKISSQSGLVIENLGSFNTSASVDFPNFQETIFGFNVTGSYSSFKNFLSTLEKSARMIEVENISFSSAKTELSPSKEKAKESFSFNLKLKVYSY